MGFNFLSKYFPPEKFLKPARLGVSFSDENIKIVSFNRESENPFIECMILPLEKNIIISGKINNIEAVTAKLTEARKSFDLPFVSFAIPDELTFIFSTSILVGEDGDASESVAFIMEENVPLTLADMVFDFVPTKVTKSEEGFTAQIVAAAAVKKEVMKFIEAFRKSGFEPIGCIHESQAIANSLLGPNFVDKICIVHAREKRVGIYLVRNGLIIFSTLRSIVDGNYEKEFIDEYEKFLEYCSKYETGEKCPMKSVLVCGEFDWAKKIVEAAVSHKDSTDDVKLANVWTNLFEIDKHIPDISYEDSLNLAGPIGAALSEIV